MPEIFNLRSYSAPTYPCPPKEVPKRFDPEVLHIQLRAIWSKAGDAISDYAESLKRASDLKLDVDSELQSVKESVVFMDQPPSVPFRVLKRMRVHREATESISNKIEFQIAKNKLHDPKLLSLDIGYFSDEEQDADGKYEASLSRARKKGIDIDFEIRCVEERKELLPEPKNDLEIVLNLCLAARLKFFYAKKIEKKVRHAEIYKKMRSGNLQIAAVEIDHAIKKWQLLAKTQGIDIAIEIKNVERLRNYVSKNSDPVLAEGKRNVLLVSKGNLHCNRIIYKCALNLIENTYREALDHPDLQTARKQNRVTECYHFLGTILPPEYTSCPVKEIELVYDRIVYEIEKAKTTLLS